MSRHMFRQRLLFSGAAIAAAAVLGAPGWGAPRDRVDLYVSVGSRGRAAVTLQLDFPPPPWLRLTQGVSQALGGTLRQPRWETSEGSWV
ncbi:MAG: hypothetical protein ACRD1G_19080, partial [Acidimicrobiales bacterium]